MAYLSLIATFIIGGGLTTLINWKLQKRSQQILTDVQKVDFADKAIGFMDRQNAGLMERICKLENDVKKLLQFKCEREKCNKRIPPQ